MVKLTTGEKIARDLCEMDAPIGNAIEVDPVDVARRIDEAMLELSQQLAAEQLNNKRLREALIAGWSLQCDFDDARRLADDALALSTDSTQILAGVRRAERERCAKVCDRLSRKEKDHAAGYGFGYLTYTADDCAEAIRAME